MAQSDVSTAAAWAGVTQGAQRAYQRNFSEEGQTRRAAMRAEKERREQELATLKATAPTEQDLKTQGEIASQELQIVKQQNQQAISQLTKNTVFSGFDRYTGDYDTRHLNTMLSEVKKTRPGQNMFGDIVRVDKLSEADRDIIKRAGLDPDLVLNNPEIQQSLLKTTRADGTSRVDDITQMFKMTGYERYASDRELKRQTEVARMYSMFGRTGAKTALERQAARMAEIEGHEPNSPEFNSFVANYIEEEQQRQQNDTFDGTKLEREAARRVQAEGLETGTDAYRQRYNEIYNQIVDRENTPSRVRTVDKVNEYVKEMEQTATEFAPSFFDIDFDENREAKLKILPYIRQIEEAGGGAMSEADKKTMHYVRSLLTSAEASGELGSRETGLIDRMVRGVKKYVSDEVGGTAATSAYAAFRNTIRHALFGSVLTDGEIKAFNDQFGNLGQQAGPVLQQFQTALKQLEGKLSALYDTNDPYVMHYRAGVDQDRLVEIMDALQERIDFFSGVAQNTSVPTGAEEPDFTQGPGRQQQAQPGQEQDVELTDEDIARLDEILGGGNQ